eukprot:JP435674.1.p1 GENE.JP435674.1~~JP435674.1.p1  ORF type:complete len:687 (-),score=179.62 JP435674.1:152-2212(-)
MLLSPVLVLLYALLCPVSSTQPFSEAQPMKMVVDHPIKPDFFASHIKAPYPTNRWWQNFVIDKGTFTVSFCPYSVQLTNYGASVGSPIKRVSDFEVSRYFDAGIELSSDVHFSKPHQIVDYDSISVSVQFGSESQGFVLPFVPGSPYVTALYTNLAPKLATIEQIQSVNGNYEHGIVEGTKFVLKLSNKQTWILYLDEPAKFTWNMFALLPEFTGGNWVVRLAVLPSQLDQNNEVIEDAELDSSAESLLDEHVKIVPTGAELAVHSEDTESTVSLHWTTLGNTTTAPLILAQPHHQGLLSHTPIPLKYETVTGVATGIVAHTWTWTEIHTDMSWTAPRPVKESRKADLIEALVQDAYNVTFQADDPYFLGKELSRVARQAIIAEELGQVEIALKLVDAIKAEMEPWINATNYDYLCYDQTWGGVVPIVGLYDAGADFGGGNYNDHHFHYGYFIYPAAVVAKLDPEWAKKNNEWVLALARDIANPSVSDPYYTQYRFFDWYSGHSWAAGLFEFYDGRNQESTSEAINAWYGLYLYGLVTDNANVKRTGQLLLASEIRGAQTYWHSTDAKSVYPKEFAKNKMCGMIWSDKVGISTWFGSGAVFAHGINMMPFTPVTELYLDQPFVSEEYPVVEQELKHGDYNDEWTALVMMDKAILDADSAWTELQYLDDFGGGNSRTNALYWAATRP